MNLYIVASVHAVFLDCVAYLFAEAIFVAVGDSFSTRESLLRLHRSHMNIGYSWRPPF